MPPPLIVSIPHRLGRDEATRRPKIRAGADEARTDLCHRGGNLDRQPPTSLRDRGLAQYEFGFAWLTPKGVEIAIQELGLEREDTAA